MTEPSVQLNTVDYTAGYLPDPDISRLNILTPIIAPSGPTDLRLVRGPSELKNLYFGGRSITASDNITAVFARGLVSNAPIWVKRGTRNNIRGGLSSSLGYEIYTDNNLNLIEGKKVSFNFNTASGSYVSYQTLLGSMHKLYPVSKNYSDIKSTAPESGSATNRGTIEQTDSGYFTDGFGNNITDENCSNYSVIYNGETYTIIDVDDSGDVVVMTLGGNATTLTTQENINITIQPNSDIVKVNSISTDDVAFCVGVSETSSVPDAITKGSPLATQIKTGLGFKQNTGLTKTNTFLVGNKYYSLSISDTNLNNLVKKFYQDGILPQVLLDEFDNIVEAHVVDGGLVIGGINEASEVGIKKVKWNSNISIVLDNDSELELLSIAPSDVVYSYRLKTGVEYNEEYELEHFYLIIPINREGESIGGYCFYTGSIQPTPTPGTYTFINISNEKINFNTFMKTMIKYASELFEGDSGEGNSIIFPNVTGNLTMKTIDGDAYDLIEIQDNEINGCINNDKFAILANFPCDSNALTAVITRGPTYSGYNTYNIDVSYGVGSTSISESWVVSFDSGVTDGYGNDLYYQNVNDQSSLIRIVELNGINVTPQTLVFGNEVTSKYSDIPEIQAAFEYIKENDESSVSFDHITDGGLVNVSLSNTIFNLCDFYNSFYVPSVRTNHTYKVQELINNRTELGQHSNARFIFGTQKSAILDNGLVELPASYFYVISRINIGNTSKEFVKFMEETNGNIGMQNPVQKFKLTDREELLNHQIVTLKKNRSGLWFLNECLTMYNVESYLQEDGTVLMINKINQITEAFASPLKGQDNTESLREDVETQLSALISSRLRVGTKFGPRGILVVCNETNNPVSLQNQRKLRIDIYSTFNRSIKDVLIYSNIIPLT